MATYYVSHDSVSTNWANATNIANPCTPLTAMSNAVAGDIVYFRGGTYTPDFTSANYETPAWYPTNDGSVGSYITFIAYPGETPVINGYTTDPARVAFGCRDNNYIIWDGFSGTMANETNTSWLFLIIGSTVGATTNCIVRNCNFTGQTVVSDAHNSAPIRLDLCVSCEVYNNTIHDNQGTGLGINACGIWLFTVQDCIFRNNEIYNCGNGIMQKNPDNETSLFYRNFIHDIGLNGFNFNEQNDTNPVGGHSCYDNLFLNIGEYGIFFGDSYPTGQPGYSIYNNTFYNVKVGIGTHGANGCKNLVNYNNIVSQITGAYQQVYMAYPPTTLNYNQYHDSSHVWYEDYNTAHTTLASWRTYTGMEANSATGDPLFVTAGGTTPASYVLDTGSPCIGTGSGGANMGVRDLSVVGVSASSSVDLSSSGIASSSLVGMAIWGSVLSSPGIASDSISARALFSSDLVSSGSSIGNFSNEGATIVTADLNVSGQSTEVFNVTTFYSTQLVADGISSTLFNGLTGIQSSDTAGGGGGSGTVHKFKPRYRKKPYAFLEDMGIEEIYEELNSNEETKSEIKKIVKPYVKNEEIDFKRLLENVEKIEQILTLYRELQQIQEDDEILMLMYG